MTDVSIVNEMAILESIMALYRYLETNNEFLHALSKN